MFASVFRGLWGVGHRCPGGLAYSRGRAETRESTLSCPRDAETGCWGLGETGSCPR